MWIFTNQGMISIVQHNREPGMLMVRAREAGVLESLFDGATVTETPDADYRFRTTLPKEDVAAEMSIHIVEIDYPNFKNSISRNKQAYHDDCLSIWSITRRRQEKQSKT